MLAARAKQGQHQEAQSRRRGCMGRIANRRIVRHAASPGREAGGHLCGLVGFCRAVT